MSNENIIQSKSGSKQHNIVFSHKGQGGFDFLLPKMLSAPKGSRTELYIYSIAGWVSLIRSPFFIHLNTKQDCEIIISLGSIRSKKGKIENRLLLWAIKLNFSFLRTLKLDKNASVLKILNFLLVGIGSNSSKINSEYFSKKNITLWFEWSRFSKLSLLLFQSIAKSGQNINMTPDSCVMADHPIVREEMHECFKQANVTFQFQTSDVQQHFLLNFPRFRDNCELIGFPSQEQVWQDKFSQIRENSKNNQFTVLYLAQKGQQTDMDKSETDPEYISAYDHMKNLETLAIVLKEKDLISTARFIYRRHPSPYYALIDRFFIQKCIELGFQLEVDKTASVWPSIFASDLVVSEFTSAYIYASEVDINIQMLTDSFDYFYNLYQPVRDAYAASVEKKRILSNEAAKVYLTEHIKC